MGRGPKKHLKRLNAPKHWMLDKLTGVWAPRPSTGPHKLRECLPLVILLRNRLKYALTAREVRMIVMARQIKVDGKVRTDTTYPAGFMDVISIAASGENFRLLYDTKGRFVIHKIDKKQAGYKLCRVRKKALGAKGIPYIVTHDGRTIRYPDPDINISDTIKFDLNTNKITDFVHFGVGKLCMVTGGHNMGRVGVIHNLEKHPGSFEIIHIVDDRGKEFTTRKSNVFVVGDQRPMVTLPHGKGIRYTILEERQQRMEKRRQE